MTTKKITTAATMSDTQRALAEAEQALEAATSHATATEHALDAARSHAAGTLLAQATATEDANKAEHVDYAATPTDAAWAAVERARSRCQRTVLDVLLAERAVPTREAEARAAAVALTAATRAVELATIDRDEDEDASLRETRGAVLIENARPWPVWRQMQKLETYMVPVIPDGPKLVTLTLGGDMGPGFESRQRAVHYRQEIRPNSGAAIAFGIPGAIDRREAEAWLTWARKQGIEARIVVGKRAALAVKTTEGLHDPDGSTASDRALLEGLDSVVERARAYARSAAFGQLQGPEAASIEKHIEKAPKTRSHDGLDAYERLARALLPLLPADGLGSIRLGPCARAVIELEPATARDDEDELIDGAA